MCSTVARLGATDDSKSRGDTMEKKRRKKRRVGGWIGGGRPVSWVEKQTDKTEPLGTNNVNSDGFFNVF